MSSEQLDPPDGLIVTKLRRDPYWRARVSLDGTTLDVDRRDGSWLTSALPRRFVLAPVAKALQAKVKRVERRETR